MKWTQLLLMIWITPVLFLDVTCQNYCCEKGLLKTTLGPSLKNHIVPVTLIITAFEEYNYGRFLQMESVWIITCENCQTLSKDLLVHSISNSRTVSNQNHLVRVSKETRLQSADPWEENLLHTDEYPSPVCWRFVVYNSQVKLAKQQQTTTIIQAPFCGH